MKSAANSANNHSGFLPMRQLSLAIIIALSAPAIAKMPPSVSARADLPSITTAKGRFAADGAVIALYHPDFKGTQRSNTSIGAEAVAREFFEASKDRLGLTAHTEMEKTFERISPEISVVRFQQHHLNLPVYGSDTAITMDSEGKVIFVANGIKQKLASISTQPNLTAEQAMDSVRTRSNSGSAYTQKAQLVIAADAGETQLAWLVTYVPNEDIGAHIEALVDAKTGDIVRFENKTLNIDGTGMAFDPDPLSSAQVNYNTTGYPDNNDADSPELVAQIRQVPLRDIRAVAGGFDLVGPYAACSSHSAPNLAGECTVSSTSDFFVASRADNRFEVSNVYYHIDTYMRHMNQTLGIAVTPSQYSGGVKFDPHGLNDDDNSSFSGATGFLQFGDGGVDDAEDADVVVHELGHGLHFWLTNGGLSNASGDGLSEGTGDYAAMSYSRAFNHWPANTPQYFWMFSWDGHNPFWNGRVTNYHLSVAWPSIGTSGPHTPGQYWASCNMLNFNSIGRLKSDRAFWRGLASTNSGTRQNDAAQAVLNAAAALNYSNADLAAMHSNFTGGQAAGKCAYTVTLPTSTTLFQNGFEN
jgi:zinc metalloprotease ZmpB